MKRSRSVLGFLLICVSVMFLVTTYNFDQVVNPEPTCDIISHAGIIYDGMGNLEGYAVELYGGPCALSFKQNESRLYYVFTGDEDIVSIADRGDHIENTLLPAWGQWAFTYPATFKVNDRESVIPTMIYIIYADRSEEALSRFCNIITFHSPICPPPAPLDSQSGQSTTFYGEGTALRAVPKSKIKFNL